MTKTNFFKIRKLTEHIDKLEGKIARLKAERERLRNNTARPDERFKLEVGR